MNQEQLNIQQAMAMAAMADGLGAGMIPFLSSKTNFRNYPSNNKTHSLGKKAKSLKRRSNCRKK